MAKEQWEDEARDQFVAFLYTATGVSYRTDAEDVLVKGGKNFDYLLGSSDGKGEPIALEIFRLMSSPAELGRSRAWSEIVPELRAELLARNVTGEYLIQTPHFFVTRPKRREFVRDVADKIARAIAQQPEAQELECEGYQMTRIPGLGRVEFSTSGLGGAFDPVGIATQRLQDKIEEKNKQLNLTGPARMILIVNWNPLVDSESMLLACSRFDFSKFANIDQVYFQAAESKFHLVFDRSVFGRVQAEYVSKEQLESPLYLQLIEARLADHDVHAFNIVKRLATESDSLEWLSSDARGTLVMIAEDFLKGDDLDNGLWIIRHLRNDPEPNIKGLLCWPLQKLVLKNRPQFYGEILDILEHYARDESESVRADVPIPLTELAARRRSKNDDGTAFIPAETSERIRALAFEMLPAATANVADRLSWVFWEIRDVSAAEAWDIVQKLGNCVDRELESLAGLLIYYAIYRERNFPELGAFNSECFRELLQATLRDGRANLRSTVLWSIWRGLKEDVRIDEVLPYLSVIPEGTFDHHIFHHLYRIVGDQLKLGNPGVCGLLISALHRESEYLSERPENQVWHFEEFFDSIGLAKKHCSREAFGEISKRVLGMADKLGTSGDQLRRLLK